jgi:hypothetical protein
MDWKELNGCYRIGGLNRTYYIFRVVDLTLLSHSCDLPIKTRVTDDGQPLWSRRDPVYLTSAAYWNLAAVISDTASGD